MPVRDRTVLSSDSFWRKKDDTSICESLLSVSDRLVHNLYYLFPCHLLSDECDTSVISSMQPDRPAKTPLFTETESPILNMGRTVRTWISTSIGEPLTNKLLFVSAIVIVPFVDTLTTQPVMPICSPSITSTSLPLLRKFSSASCSSLIFATSKTLSSVCRVIHILPSSSISGSSRYLIFFFFLFPSRR